jgi:hypothetical protein
MKFIRKHIADLLPVPAWTGKTENAVAAIARWNFEFVPDDMRHLPALFRRSFEYPFEGARYGDRITWCFVLPQGSERGYVYRQSGGDYFNDGDLAKGEYIMWEVTSHAETLFRADVRSALAAERKRTEADAAAERQRAAAECQRAAVTAAYLQELREAAERVPDIQRAWLAALEEDKARALSEIREGRAATLSKDWKAEAEAERAKIDRMDKSRKDAQVFLAKLSSVWATCALKAQWAAEEVTAKPGKLAVAAVAEATRRRIEGPTPLSDAAGAEGVVFGTHVETGADFIVPVKKLEHMLVAGVPGSGKSVLLHAIVTALVRSDEVERIIAIDLKGGLEFERYSNSGKVQVVWEFDDVVRTVDELMQLAIERQNSMRQNRQQLWPHGRTVLVIDEFGELQTSIDTATEREEKARAKRLAANLLSLARRARALGILLVFSLQKATTDAMDSSLRNNLACRLVLRQANRLTAQSLLESEELEDLPVWPTELPDGRFYYCNPARGELKLLQAQIAPGIELNGD